MGIIRKGKFWLFHDSAITTLLFTDLHWSICCRTKDLPLSWTLCGGQLSHLTEFCETIHLFHSETTYETLQTQLCETEEEIFKEEQEILLNRLNRITIIRTPIKIQADEQHSGSQRNVSTASFSTVLFWKSTESTSSFTRSCYFNRNLSATNQMQSKVTWDGWSSGTKSINDSMRPFHPNFRIQHDLWHKGKNMAKDWNKIMRKRYDKYDKFTNKRIQDVGYLSMHKEPTSLKVFIISLPNITPRKLPINSRCKLWGKY
jgi:hypothetical protein